MRLNYDEEIISLKSILSAVLIIASLALASCAPLSILKGEKASVEEGARESMNSAPVVPVSVIDISPDDFVIMDSPGRLEKYKDLEVSIDVRDMTVAQAITLLFREYGIDHFIAEKETGKGVKISLMYRGPLQNLLDSIAMQYGYFFSEENGVIRVSDERTYVFSVPPLVSELLVNDIASQWGSSKSNNGYSSSQSGSSPEASSGTQNGASGSGDRTQKTGSSLPSAAPAAATQAEDLKTTLKNMGAKDVVIDETNSLVSFKCNKSSFSHIQAYLKKVKDSVAIVSLDVIVAEVDLDNSHSRGIDWSVLYNKDGKKNATFQLPAGLDPVTNPGSLAFGLISSRWDITSVLSFLETQGRTEVLQKPTLTVLNGNRAFLRAGTEIPYVGEIKITPTQVGTAISYFEEVTFNSVLQGIEIEMLPKVKEDLLIISIRGVVTDLLEFVERDTGQGGKIERPVTTTRDVQSVTALKAGEILKIGGVIIKRGNKTSHGVPGADVTGLTDLLFTQRTDTSSRSEIVILIKPQIIRFREKKG